MEDGLKMPPFFSCAQWVHVPYVGAGTTRTPPLLPSLKPDNLKKDALSCDPNPGYLQRISSDISFSEDVVRDRSFHLLPYDKKYLKEVFDTSDIVSSQPRKRYVRPLQKISQTNHPSDQTRTMQRPNSVQKATNTAALGVKEEQPTSSSVLPEDDKKKNAFVTQSKTVKGDRTPEWDETLLTKISRPTARWIVSHRVSPGQEQKRLTSFLEEHHRDFTDDKSELIKETLSEADSSDTQEVDAERKWKTSEEKFLKKVEQLTKQSHDPSSEMRDTAFCHLPATAKPVEKLETEDGAINFTAQNLVVKPLEIPPPPVLRDHMNPALQKFIYDTDNLFQQERLTGAQQIFDPAENGEVIVTEHRNVYRKRLQSITPRPATDWCPQKRASRKSKRVSKGLQRWKSLPELVEDTVEKTSVTALNLSTKKEKSCQPKNHSIFVQIVTDWREKWHLDMRYAEANPCDLIRDMADRNVRTRLEAIVTCARAAEYRPSHAEAAQVEQMKLLPESLFVALECCLEDEHVEVRRAAAITLFVLERPTEHAKVILQETLKETKSVDRWTAAQCLACCGQGDSDVVGELALYLLNDRDAARQERAAQLLVQLSESCAIVHHMLAEQLNTSSWEHRVVVCRTLSRLRGQMNKDLVNKLTFLAWNDWHSEVRKAAAQALADSGHGKELHDELRAQITHGDEKSRIEAVQKIGHLGIMTAQLFPVFLRCFADSHVSVRMEACATCSDLRIKEPKVIEALIFVANYDPTWRVKALAIQALGTIGEVTESVRECVLWGLRYEKEPGVRAEACRAAVNLGFDDPDFAKIVTDRFLVETSPAVKHEISKAFQTLGICPHEDTDNIAQIKEEVRKLCAKDLVRDKIALNEEAKEEQMNRQRMIACPEPPQVKKAEGNNRLHRPHSGCNVRELIEKYRREKVFEEGSEA